MAEKGLVNELKQVMTSLSSCSIFYILFIEANPGMSWMAIAFSRTGRLRMLQVCSEGKPLESATTLLQKLPQLRHPNLQRMIGGIELEYECLVNMIPAFLFF